MTVTPERWQRIVRIYELAIDQDAAAREVLLSKECAGDVSLRSEVESLLRQDEQSVLLDRPVWATAASLFDTEPDLQSGAILGPYRIEHPIGAGGMGQVFCATDTRLNRLVAIKVLPGELAANEEMRSRFGDEAKAVAALTHPHICTLYDVGRHEKSISSLWSISGRDARLEAGRRSAAARAGCHARDPDRQCARPRASTGHRSSRSEARQHHADGERREAPRLRPGQTQAGRRLARALGCDACCRDGWRAGP